MADQLVIAGRAFNSRLIVGTGKYRSFDEMRRAHQASGAEMVTVAVRRVNLTDKSKESLLDYIDRENFFILPNTAGCYSADEAVRRTFADPSNAPDYAALDDAAVEEVARDREAAVLYGWRPYMHNPSLTHWLHRVSVPTLVLWGEQDRIVAPAYGERLTQAIPGARFTTIAAAGHYPQIEQPETVAAAIETFARENRR